MSDDTQDRVSGVLIPLDMVTNSTDERGRIYLGTEWADMDEVRVAILSASEDGESVEELTELSSVQDRDS